MRAAVIVNEYSAPLSMMTRRIGDRQPPVLYSADRLVTCHILYANATMGRHNTISVHNKDAARTREKNLHVAQTFVTSVTHQLAVSQWLGSAAKIPSDSPIEDVANA